MPIEIGDKLPLLMVTLATALAVVPVVIFFVHCMIDGELGVVAGLCAIGVALLLLAVSILAPHPIIPAIVLITIIASIVMFPFARSELDKREHKVLDTAQLEKAHREFAQRPDNVYSRFAIAKHLYDHGLAGHAIAIAEEAGSSLSREVDPVRNASQRDLFDRELDRVELMPNTDIVDAQVEDERQRNYDAGQRESEIGNPLQHAAY
ncbi:MAG: hypothetical protein IH851_10920 [Armatimonadetes bacterium]|nr:hypothetical protein [Armatimonadota bacterium]